MTPTRSRLLAIAAFLVSIAGLLISWRTYVRRNSPRLRPTLVRDNTFDPIPSGRRWAHVGADKLKLDVVNIGGIQVHIDRVRLRGQQGAPEHQGEPTLPRQLAPGDEEQFVVKTSSTTTSVAKVHVARSLWRGSDARFVSDGRRVSRMLCARRAQPVRSGNNAAIADWATAKVHQVGEQRTGTFTPAPRMSCSKSLPLRLIT
jgi:hypothetical protein